MILDTIRKLNEERKRDLESVACLNVADSDPDKAKEEYVAQINTHYASLIDQALESDSVFASDLVPMKDKSALKSGELTLERYQSLVETVSAANTETTAVQRYGESESALVAYVNTKGFLSENLLPVLKKINALGISHDQIDRLVSVVYDNAKNRGKPNKVLHYLEAIDRTQDADFLATLSTDPVRFRQFLDFAQEVEEFRESLGGERSGITYHDCFSLVQKLGKENVLNMISKLVDENPFSKRNGWVTSNYKAIYTLKSILEESEKSGRSPEALLDFRLSELPSNYFSEKGD